MQTAIPKVARACLAASVFGLAFATSVVAASEERDPLIGSWKLESWQVIAEGGTPHDLFGASPKGYLVLTPEGRSIVVLAKERFKIRGREVGAGRYPRPQSCERVAFA